MKLQHFFNIIMLSTSTICQHIININILSPSTRCRHQQIIDTNTDLFVRRQVFDKKETKRRQNVAIAKSIAKFTPMKNNECLFKVIVAKKLLKKFSSE